jgi:ATP-dependent Clp protease adapter protein ClpS
MKTYALEIGPPGSPGFAPDTFPRAASTEVEEGVLVATEERIDTPWRVILFNDHIHTFDEVILQIVKATGCTLEQATRYAFTAHVEGKVCVFEGEFEACFRVQGVLREIQLVTEIEG